MTDEILKKIDISIIELNHGEYKHYRALKALRVAVKTLQVIEQDTFTYPRGEDASSALEKIAAILEVKKAEK